MNIENVNQRISGLRGQLDEKPAVVNKLLRELNLTTDQDHKAILSCLKSAFSAILTPVTAPTVPQMRLKVQLDALKAAVGSHLANMTLIKKQTDDLSTEVQIINRGLQHCCESGEKILEQGSATATEEKERERQQQMQMQMAADAEAEAEEAELAAKVRLEEEMTQLQTLDTRIEDNRHRRVGLRAARVMAWGATLVFPPAAVVAAGMEVGAQ